MRRETACSTPPSQSPARLLAVPEQPLPAHGLLRAATRAARTRRPGISPESPPPRHIGMDPAAVAEAARRAPNLVRIRDRLRAPAPERGRSRPCPPGEPITSVGDLFRRPGLYHCFRAFLAAHQSLEQAALIEAVAEYRRCDVAAARLRLCVAAQGPEGRGLAGGGDGGRGAGVARGAGRARGAACTGKRKGVRFSALALRRFAQGWGDWDSTAGGSAGARP